MIYKKLTDELIELSLSMFRKNFFGIFHGSISAKLEGEKFIINTKNAIFDEMKSEDFITVYFKEDYRYKNASIDTHIHRNIYKEISDAKYVCYAFPPNITSLSLKCSTFLPKDYFGSLYHKKIDFYDPKEFSDWYKRAPSEIATYLKNQGDIMLIKGYGVYTYSRNIKELVKKIAIIENSAKIILNN